MAANLSVVLSCATLGLLEQDGNVAAGHRHNLQPWELLGERAGQGEDVRVREAEVLMFTRWRGGRRPGWTASRHDTFIRTPAACGCGA
ncbi:unnamed protein product [Lota lota]